MKKLLYTLLAVSIIFSACEKEDSNSNSNINTTVSNMTGIWEATSLVLDGANLSSLATILYWLKADMTIEENVQYNNSSNIDDNITIDSNISKLFNKVLKSDQIDIFLKVLNRSNQNKWYRK